jgi:SAM-dependent methyltransferase
MPSGTVELRTLIAGMSPKTSRYLLDYMKLVQAERLGKIPSLRLRLPRPPFVRKAVGLKVRSLDRETKSEVANYAYYLKMCERARISQIPVRTNQRVCWWSPTPRSVVIEALKLAEVGPDDIVFDLGCGDGRVMVDAAQLFGARAVGFDIDPQRIREARTRIKRSGVEKRVQARQQSILAIPDLYKATVIYLYLTQRALNRVMPILARRCRPGTRIVSVDTWNFRWRAEKELWLRGWRYKWRVGLWYV